MLTGTPQVRRLLPGDEAQARSAHAELAAEGFDFMLGYDDGEDFAAYLARLGREEHGQGLAPGYVPHTFLVAVAGGALVGRVSLRHELTPMLAAIGGHIGYGVRPAFRHRGHATALLRAGIRTAAGLGLKRVLVTCDDTNAASIAVIERCGGVYEDSVELLPGHAKLRYWIPATGSPSPPPPG
ncbi:GNAT family N-acetyltransferase [Arthrobacter sp. JSM 101049]|uniref:GNAT family N-acetyltransferase n=1 Tax=Arthrobacter sp. JSM 101049 TaxID=929097 RepID=UPI003563D2E1